MADRRQSGAERSAQHRHAEQARAIARPAVPLRGHFRFPPGRAWSVRPVRASFIMAEQDRHALDPHHEESSPKNKIRAVEVPLAFFIRIFNDFMENFSVPREASRAESNIETILGIPWRSS